MKIQSEVENNSAIPPVFLKNIPQANRCLMTTPNGKCDPIDISANIGLIKPPQGDDPSETKISLKVDACMPPYQLDGDTNECITPPSCTNDNCTGKTLAFIPNTTRMAFYNLMLEKVKDIPDQLKLAVGGIYMLEPPAVVGGFEGCYDPLFCVNQCEKCAVSCLNNGEVDDENLGCLTHRITGKLNACAQQCGKCNEYLDIASYDPAIASWWATNKPLIAQLATAEPFQVPDDCKYSDQSNDPKPHFQQTIIYHNEDTNLLSCSQSVPCQSTVPPESEWGADCKEITSFEKCNDQTVTDKNSVKQVCTWDVYHQTCKPSCCYAKCFKDDIPVPDPL